MSKLIHCDAPSQQGELLLVEGQSALYAVSQVRNRASQAVLALQGKVPNASKRIESQLLQNDQVAALASALGCGSGENCQIAQMKYRHCVILSEADADGIHASHLLSLLFRALWKPLLDTGRVAIIRAPAARIDTPNGTYLYHPKALSAANGAYNDGIQRFGVHVLRGT